MTAIHKTINDLTIEEVTRAAKQNAGRYIDRAKNIAENVFVEGVLWAQKVHQERRIIDIESD